MASIHTKRFVLVVLVAAIAVGVFTPIGIGALEKAGYLHGVPRAAKAGLGLVVFLLFYALFRLALRQGQDR